MTKDALGGSETQPMSFSSWLYGFANPINLVDPSGNFASEYLEFTYTRGYGPRERPRWEDADERALDNSAQAVAIALAQTINNELIPFYYGLAQDMPVLKENSTWLISFLRTVTPPEAFMQVFGNKVEIQRQTITNGNVWAATVGSNLIYLYKAADTANLSNPIYSRFLSHELGHAFGRVINGTNYGPDFIHEYLIQDLCEPFDAFAPGIIPIPAVLDYPRDGLRSNSPSTSGGYWQFHPDSNEMDEVFADMFVAWTYDDPYGQRGWATNPDGSLTTEGSLLSNIIDLDMSMFIDAARWRWYEAGRWQ